MKRVSIISGFTDEVSDDLGVQIKALKELGWSCVDLRTVDGKNVSTLTDDEFDRIHDQLGEHGITIACFGSTVANWGRDPINDFDTDLAEMKRSVRHMGRAAVRSIRIMSYRVAEPVPLGNEIESRILFNIGELVKIAEDNGVICLHENCQTWGGQSPLHSLRLLEAVDSPALRLIFDTGNPVSMKDVRGEAPYRLQDALDFYHQVKAYVDYIHIKDAVVEDGRARYVFPGEGHARVREILADVARHKTGIPISIEPHVSVVFHDPSVQAPFEERWKNFISCGRLLVEMAAQAGIVLNVNKQP
ncbi:MAG: sugar phosphate isomerase/epimerase [Desulfofustis sp.]|jgi:sugar phosphate isomerase/epimerase|nr:sugar phosphate isomerase/epimerase [Desulfofustis sp.]